MKTSAALDAVGLTDAGCVRPNNEDNFAVDEDLGLLVVADGMGGHNSGEVASDLAVRTVVDYARKLRGGKAMVVPEGGDPLQSVAARQLRYCLKSANTLIYEKGRAFPKDAGMGTTIVAALVEDGRLVVAHVGDSRLYVLRNGRLEALTEDHSLVADQVRRGLITAEAAAQSHMQNILTRALGAEEDVQVDVSEHPLLAGDVLLLATDGLTKMLSDAQIAEALASSPAPREIAAALIARAKEAGGVDNVTVIVAKAPPAAGRGLPSLLARLLGR